MLNIPRDILIKPKKISTLSSFPEVRIRKATEILKTPTPTFMGFIF